MRSCWLGPMKTYSTAAAGWGAGVLTSSAAAVGWGGGLTSLRRGRRRRLDGFKKSHVLRRGVRASFLQFTQSSHFKWGGSASGTWIIRSQLSHRSLLCWGQYKTASEARHDSQSIADIRFSQILFPLQVILNILFLFLLLSPAGCSCPLL